MKKLSNSISFLKDESQNSVLFEGINDQDNEIKCLIFSIYKIYLGRVTDVIKIKKNHN